MQKRKLFTRIGVYTFFIICLLLLLKRCGYTVAHIHPTTLQKIANDSLVLLLLIMLFIMILQNLFTFIPLVLVITTNITLFGFWPGYLYGCLCSVIGSMLMFFSIRYIFSNLFAQSVARKYDAKLKKNGFFFVLSARILPFIPTNLINIAAALSPIKAAHFFAATAIGNMVYSFVLASISLGLISTATYNPIYLIALAVIALISYLIYRKKLKKPMTQ